jgi:hypothetical protein
MTWGQSVSSSSLQGESDLTAGVSDGWHARSPERTERAASAKTYTWEQDMRPGHWPTERLLTEYLVHKCGTFGTPRNTSNGVTRLRNLRPTVGHPDRFHSPTKGCVDPPGLTHLAMGVTWGQPRVRRCQAINP